MVYNLIHSCAYVLSGYDLEKIAGGIHIEHNYRQTVLPAHSSGSDIHHFQPACEHLIIGYLVKLHRCGVLLRIGSVDTVHTRALEHHIGTDLDAAERARW